MKEQDSQWYNNKEKIPHVYDSEHSLTNINSIHCRMLESEQECTVGIICHTNSIKFE